MTVKNISIVLGLYTFVFMTLLMLTAQKSTVFAGESDSTQVKTQEQIDAYRSEMQAKKAEMIKAYKEREAANTRGMTPAQIREYKLNELRESGMSEAEIEAKTNAKKSQAEIDAYQAKMRTQKDAQIQEKRAENQERIDEKVDTFVEVLRGKVTTYYDRLSQLSDKLETRIDKLDEEGADMTEANAKLAVADTTLEGAYQNAVVMIDDIAGTEVNSSESLSEVISKVRELKNPFQESLEAYKEVATEIRMAVIELKAEAQKGEARQEDK